MSYFNPVSSVSSSLPSSQPSSSAPVSPLSRLAAVAAQSLRLPAPVTPLADRAIPLSGFFYSPSVPPTRPTVHSVVSSRLSGQSASSANAPSSIPLERPQPQSAVPPVRKPVSLNLESIEKSLQTLQSFFGLYKRMNAVNVASIAWNLQQELKTSNVMAFMQEPVAKIVDAYRQGHLQVSRSTPESLASLNSDSILTSFRTLQTFFSSYEKINPQVAAVLASTIQKKLGNSEELAYMKQLTATILAEYYHGDLHLNQVDRWNNQGEYEKVADAIPRLLFRTNFDLNMKAKLCCQLIFALDKLGRHDEALAEVRKCLAISAFVDENIKFEIYNYLASGLNREHNYKESIVAARIALAFSSESSEMDKLSVYYMLTSNLFRLGKYDEALIEIRKCLSFQSLDNACKAVLYFRLTTTLSMQGKFDEVIVEAERGLVLSGVTDNGTKLKLYLLLARALNKTCNYIAASVAGQAGFAVSPPCEHLNIKSQLFQELIKASNGLLKQQMKTRQPSSAPTRKRGRAEESIVEDAPPAKRQRLGSTNES